MIVSPPVILSMVIAEVQTEVSLPEFKEAKQRGEMASTSWPVRAAVGGCASWR
jgi:hypothetical protein